MDEVVLAYSDLSHAEVMHKASAVLGAGADFRLLGPERTMLESTKPVVAICAVRTGSGKSQTSRYVARILREAGLDVVLVRHPMPYGDLERMRVQRFASLEDIDGAHPTIEEREEYEASVEAGLIVYAGVDYAEILELAQEEADLIVWDGGNNDLPFFRPDLLVVVVDPLRAGHELAYHPGETNLRMADVVVVNKVDSADRPRSSVCSRISARSTRRRPSSRRARRSRSSTASRSWERLCSSSRTAQRSRTAECRSVQAWSQPSAAERARSSIPGLTRSARSQTPTSGTRTSARCSPRWATPTSSFTSSSGRSTRLTATSLSSATPTDLTRLIHSRHPVRHATYELQEVGRPTLADLLAPIVDLTKAGAPSLPRTALG